MEMMALGLKRHSTIFPAENCFYTSIDNQGFQKYIDGEFDNDPKIKANVKISSYKKHNREAITFNAFSSHHV